MERLEADVLIVGRGLSGLMAAWHAAQAGANVLVLGLGGGASGWLQGLNVAHGHADPRDNTAVHAADILREGAGINRPDLVSDTVERAIDGFMDLVALGVPFARDDGGFRQRRAVGSSYARSCYVAESMWGPAASKILLARLSALGNVRLERRRVVRILRSDQSVAGAVVVDPRDVMPGLVRAPVVVIASGGVGSLYAHSTYPADITGASYALAHHAGAAIADVEFMQYEPLVARNPSAARGYAYPTTLLSEGAVLRDRDGKRFLLETRPEGEVGIGKEELVRCIAEMADAGRSIDGTGVWLDATAVPTEKLANYRWLGKFFRSHGLDPAKEPLDIWPAAHASLGGIVVDRERSSTVPGIYAVGEAATGIHGAGRIGAGSGTDVLASGVIAGRAAAAAAQVPALPWAAVDEVWHRQFDIDVPANDLSDRDWAAFRQRLAVILSEAGGIFRTDSELGCGLKALQDLAVETMPDVRPHPGSRRLELADRLLVAELILAAARGRQESRGTHMRRDFPQPVPALASSRASMLAGQTS